MVIDDAEGEIGQDWCESRHSRTVCRISDGRGRHSAAVVQGLSFGASGDSGHWCRSPYDEHDGFDDADDGKVDGAVCLNWGQQ